MYWGTLWNLWFLQWSCHMLNPFILFLSMDEGLGHLNNIALCTCACRVIHCPAGQTHRPVSVTFSLRPVCSCVRSTFLSWGKRFQCQNHGFYWSFWRRNRIDAHTGSGKCREWNANFFVETRRWGITIKVSTYFIYWSWYWGGTN